MPYVSRKEKSKEISIYYEVHGSGEPIIFHHGKGLRSLNWHELGYVHTLKKDFQLILIDLRGYGNSSKPHDTGSYDIEALADDTAMVLDAVGIESAHCLGASFSASWCFFMARYYPSRIKSYIFFTPGVLFTTIVDPKILASMKQGPKTYLAQIEEIFGPCKYPCFRESFLANDTQALYASNTAPWYDYHQYIHYINKPSLIYTGEKEMYTTELTNLSKHLPDCILKIIPKIDHIDAYCRSDLAIPVIKTFLNNLMTNTKNLNQ